MMEFFLSLTFWKTVLASTTPVMLATLAANMMTKAGIFNLAIEGTMLICALTGVVVSAFTQNLWIGCIAAVAMGILVSFIFGYFSLIMKGAMNACGVAMNLIATGGTVFVLVMLTAARPTQARSRVLRSRLWIFLLLKIFRFLEPLFPDRTWLLILDGQLWL